LRMAIKPALSEPGLPESGQVRELMLPITGMTCASCVRRVEKALSKVSGVAEASVNLATEKARISFDPDVASMGQLQAAVEKAGYHLGAVSEPAALSSQPIAAGAPSEPVDQHAVERRKEIDSLRTKSLVSLAAGVAMMALMFLPLPLDHQVLAPVLLIVAT